MSHPDSLDTRTTSASTPSAASSAGDLQLPLPSTDERPAEQAPAKPHDALQQARELLAAGETSAGMTTLRALVAREPRNARARAVLADQMAKMGDLEGALAELGRALEAAPDDVPILCARAALFTARARYDQAEADLRRAVRLDDGSADVQLQLGMLFSRRARWREAIEPLRAAVDANPTLFAAHYYLGDAYNSIDDLPSALKAYQKAVELEPTHYRALKAIGVVLDRLRRPAEAAVAYQRAREAQRR